MAWTWPGLMRWCRRNSAAWSGCDERRDLAGGLGSSPDCLLQDLDLVNRRGLLVKLR